MVAARGDGPAEAGGPPVGPVERVTAGLAVAGGTLVLSVAVLVTVSVLMRWTAHRNIPGDFELVQIGISLATFAFLPLCQLRGTNIFVDTFTRGLLGRTRALLDGLWTLVYLLIACLITARMAAGGVETIASGTTSMVLGLPIGWAILVASLLSAWLVVVVLATAIRTFRGTRS